MEMYLIVWRTDDKEPWRLTGGLLRKRSTAEELVEMEKANFFPLQFAIATVKIPGVPNAN